jgi:signal transduction histidine kinase
MVIEGYIHLLLTEEEQGDPEQQAMLTAIRNNAERIHRMAEKFIWYTRAQVSIPDFDGNAVVANANEVIIRVATIICARLGRRLDLIFSLYPASLRISEENLTKIVEELVENACKFSKVGTKITLQGILEGSDYKLAVTNYGKPMTPEQVQRIGGFMQFERDKQEQQGTGLGLVIAKRLAELAGGGLGVKSDEHETVISVRLKRAADIFRENMLTVEDDDTQPLLPIADLGPGDPAGETVSTAPEIPTTPPTAPSLATSTSIIPLKLETAGDTPPSA